MVWSLVNSLYHTDIRKGGSHNIGTTNAYRMLGPVGGSIVLVLDILKARWLPATHSLGIEHHWLVLIVGLAAVFGHTFSIYIRFKGGRRWQLALAFYLHIIRHFCHCICHLV